jgi:hypothetical protein
MKTTKSSKQLLTKVVLSFLLCLGFYFGEAQARVPEKILQKLDSLFPQNSDVAWSKKKDNYTADFIYQNFNVSLTFDGRGEVTRRMQEIEKKNLPETISAKVDKSYANCKVLYVLQKTVKDKVEYEIELMKGSSLYIVNFDSKGRLVDVSEVYKNSIFFPIVN